MKNVFIILMCAMLFSCAEDNLKKQIVSEIEKECSITFNCDTIDQYTYLYRATLKDSIFYSYNDRIKDIIDKKLNTLHKTIKENSISNFGNGVVSFYEWETPQLSVKYETDKHLVKNETLLRFWIRLK